MQALPGWISAALHGRTLAELPASARLQEAVAQLPLVQEVQEAQHLLQRLDQKFVLPAAQLPALLQALLPTHAVLAAGEQRLAWYVTEYFDTAGAHLLRDHLRGKRPRHKVRVRHYLDRDLTFLEIKTKLASGQTRKLRRALAHGASLLTVDDQGWLQQQLQAGGWPHTQLSLRPAAWTLYQRITLLHRSQPERVTLDVNLRLGTAQGGSVFAEQVIVELKRARRDWAQQQYTMHSLRALGARPAGLSKYVAAMMSAPDAQQARFKAALGRFANKNYWEGCEA